MMYVHRIVEKQFYLTFDKEGILKRYGEIWRNMGPGRGA